jgi:hypothetical protein
MPIIVKAPDGSQVEFPEGTPVEVMRDAMRRKFGGPEAVGDGMPWADVPGLALRNSPESARQFVSNLAYAVSNPIDTAWALGDLGAGAIRAGGRAVLPEPVFQYLDSFNADAAARAGRTASAVGDFYADRYGSESGLKNAVANDPIGVLADASTVMTGGAGVARSALGAGSKTAAALDTAARFTNPLSPVIETGKLAGKAAGGAAKGLLGVTTNTSADTIGEAYLSGLLGGDAKKAFVSNMRGADDATAAVEEARRAIGQIAETRSKQYAEDMKSIRADKRPVDFMPIEQRFFEIVDSMYSGQHQVASNEAVKKLAEIADVLSEWSADKSMHTAGGLDALKRRIDNLMPSFADANAGDTERAVTAVRNAVKDEIIRVAPEYKKAMQNYESSKVAQREIERSLSLGKSSATDTALRKMQAVARNGVSDGAGGRAKAFEALKEAGAETLMPRLAGQALNKKMPRGVMKALAGASLIGGGFFNPAFFLGAPLTSPRLIGEAANLAGTAARYAKKLPLPSREQVLGWQHQGRVGLLGQQ